MGPSSTTMSVDPLPALDGACVYSPQERSHLKESTMSHNPAEFAVRTVMGLVHHYWLSRCVWVAAELGIADQLVKGPRSADELAKSLGTQPNATRRLMRALVSEGFFAEEGGKYSNSPKSDALRSDVPWSMRAVARAELG